MSAIAALDTGPRDEGEARNTAMLLPVSTIRDF
jgi:hypothetical protein